MFLRQDIELFHLAVHYVFTFICTFLTISICISISTSIMPSPHFNSDDEVKKEMSSTTSQLSSEMPAS